MAGVLIGRSSYRSGLPLLLVFLFVGMVFGTDGLGIQFSNMHTSHMPGLLVNPHEMLKIAAVSLLMGVFMIVIGRPLSVFLCLAPFRKINIKSKLFVSWVGLRGGGSDHLRHLSGGVGGSGSVRDLQHRLLCNDSLAGGTGHDCHRSGETSEPAWRECARREHFRRGPDGRASYVAPHDHADRGAAA